MRSHFKPIGNRLEGVYLFTYERELNGIVGGQPQI